MSGVLRATTGMCLSLVLEPSKMVDERRAPMSNQTGEYQEKYRCLKHTCLGWASVKLLHFGYEVGCKGVGRFGLLLAG